MKLLNCNEQEIDENSMVRKKKSQIHHLNRRLNFIFLKRFRFFESVFKLFIMKESSFSKDSKFTSK